MQSVGLTFATLAAMLLAYRSGLIKPTEKFKLGVVAATGAIALFYVVGFVLSFFGIAMPFLQGNSTAIPKKERSEEHTSELQSRLHLVCRLLLEKKKKKKRND